MQIGSGSIKTILGIIIILNLFLLAGWGMSLYRLTQCDFEPPYKAEIIYSVSLVTPISIVTGWMDFGK